MMREMIFLLLVLLFNTVSGGDRWPDFRGPRTDGSSDATGLPLFWSEENNIKWKTAIHDRGWSSPVILDGKIWLTTAKENGTAFYVLCVNFDDGKILHDIEVFTASDPQRINDLNSYATPSPVVEENRVYVHFGTFGTCCLDTQSGKTIWSRRDLNCNHLQGPVSSPFLFENLVILHLEGTDEQYIVALDKHTGKTVWKVHRPKELYEKTIPLYRKAYITPIIIRLGDKPLLISNGAQSCHAYDPRTGREIWYVVYGGDSTISRPVSDGELVFINTGFSKDDVTLLAVRPDGEGNVTESHVVWKIEGRVPIESSPVFAENFLFMVDDNGTASCVDPRSGEILWKEEIEGRYGASPVYADGRIYFFNKKGKTTVVKSSRTFEQLATNSLDEGFMASPAIVGKSLVVRSITHLYRIED